MNPYGAASFGSLRRESLGCPLSPVMGAFFLRSVDQALGKLGLFSVRFMDGIAVSSSRVLEVEKGNTQG